MSNNKFPTLQALKNFTAFLGGVKNAYYPPLVGDLEAIKQADSTTLRPVIEALKEKYDLPYSADNLESAIKFILFILSIISDPKLKERTLLLIEEEYNAREYQEDRISIADLLSLVKNPEYQDLINKAMLALSSHNTSPFASSLPVYKGVDIISRGKHLPWVFDDYNILTHTHSILRGKGALFFQVTNDLTSPTPAALAGAAAETVINSFDIRAACIHLIYASHLPELLNPIKDEFIINADDLIKILGIDKNKHTTKQQKLSLIEELAVQPARIMVHGTYPQQGKKKGFVLEKDRLWDVGVRVYFDEHKVKTGISIRVRAGMWASSFFNNVGKDAFMQYGYVSKNLLQTITSIWQHNEGAARMMLWLLFQLRISNKRTMKFRASTLMEIAYDPESIKVAQIDRRLRSRLAKRWADDLRTIHNKGGWKVSFDDNEYPLEIQPELEPGNINEDPLMGTGFWEKLLAASVSFEAPAELVKKASCEVLAPTPFQPKPLRIGPTKAPANQQQDQKVILTAEWIADTRKKMGLSQREFAAKMARSPSWVAQIETGRKKVPENLVSVIQKILTQPPIH